MSELKLEDLNAGDKLEFVSDEIKQDYLDSFKEVNWDLVENCFSEGVAVVKEITNRGVYLEYKDHSRLRVIHYRELKYFRKVESKGLGQFVDVTVTVGEETPYVLVDAGIKDEKDMYTRLLNGEVFLHKEVSILFNGESFVVKYDDGLETELMQYAKEFKQFKVKKPWYETASDKNPILCKVWDDHDADFCYQRVIFKECGYHTEEENIWENATPVKASECFDG